jgi:hypothetical protein
MQRRTFAAIAVGVGLLVGLLANLFFYNKQFGLSVPLFVGVVSASILMLSLPARRYINRRNLWPLIPMLFFAAMTAIRDDWMILWLNLGAITALGALLLHYMSLPRPLDEESFAAQTGGVLQTGFLVLPYAVGETSEAWAWLRDARQERGRQFASVLRGSAFAAPVVLVFAVLLGSADAVFADYVGQAWNGLSALLGIGQMGETIARLGVTLIFGTLMTGAVGYSLMRRLNPPAEVTDDYVFDSSTVHGEGQEVSDDSPSLRSGEGVGGRGFAEVEKRKPAFKLSMIESGIVLGSVALLFAAFVVIQFAYFFGGESNINAAGLTYAQYARRGFFELVAVSTMTLGMALFLDRVTLRQEGSENKVFRVLSVILVALTTVMLTSAAQRMWLYEEAYGFTQLRVYTHVAIAWLGVMFGIFLLALFRIRKNVFSLGTLLVLIGYLGTLNLMNVDHYIAERNVARYHDGQELDIAFLNILSADAVPVIVPLYKQSEPGTEVYDWAGQWLARQQFVLEGERNSNGSTVFSWNAGREMAWMQINAARMVLPEYDSSLWYGSFWTTSDAEYEDYYDAWEDGVTPRAVVTPAAIPTTTR